MNLPSTPLLRRWLALWLATLLALGPFLHSHFGASHESGFHLDGVHALHSPQPATVIAIQSPDEESLAIGVATSLPQSEDDASDAPAWFLLLATLPLLSLWRQLLVFPTAMVRKHAQPDRLYRAGLPPPCLAPPAV